MPDRKAGCLAAERENVLRLAERVLAEPDHHRRQALAAALAVQQTMMALYGHDTRGLA